jgi:hypothetical protein
MASLRNSRSWQKKLSKLEPIDFDGLQGGQSFRDQSTFFAAIDSIWQCFAPRQNGRFRNFHPLEEFQYVVLLKRGDVQPLPGGEARQVRRGGVCGHNSPFQKES